MIHRKIDEKVKDKFTESYWATKKKWKPRFGKVDEKSEAFDEPLRDSIRACISLMGNLLNSYDQQERAVRADALRRSVQMLSDELRDDPKMLKAVVAVQKALVDEPRAPGDQMRSQNDVISEFTNMAAQTLPGLPDPMGGQGDGDPNAQALLGSAPRLTTDNIDRVLESDRMAALLVLARRAQSVSNLLGRGPQPRPDHSQGEVSERDMKGVRKASLLGVCQEGAALLSGVLPNAQAVEVTLQKGLGAANHAYVRADVQRGTSDSTVNYIIDPTWRQLTKTFGLGMSDGLPLVLYGSLDEIVTKLGDLGATKPDKARQVYKT